MSTTAWIVIGVGLWLLLSFVVVRMLAGTRRSDESQPVAGLKPDYAALMAAAATGRRRILLVDDDPSLRLLLRTTLELDEFVLEEAGSAEDAAQIARFWSPAVVILDVGLPGMDGLAFCKELKRDARYGMPWVVLLTGQETTRGEIEAAGPDAVLRKPFSPIELIGLLDRLDEPGPVFVGGAEPADAEQLLVYARDLSSLLAVERSQRRLLQQSYRQTAIALADALEAKDPVTGLHALRVQRYAVELVAGIDPRLLDDPSLEYGFLLHDVGKVGIPDEILRKPGPLTGGERVVMEQHTLLGEAILGNVTLLGGQGLQVVRSHHERWDGGGYPDRLAGTDIPIAARIFALVDAMDAMTTERPYRHALSWEAASDEILAQAGLQFDPRVVAAFAQREGRMRKISQELAEAAA